MPRLVLVPKPNPDGKGNVAAEYCLDLDNIFSLYLLNSYFPLFSYLLNPNKLSISVGEIWRRGI